MSNELKCYFCVWIDGENYGYSDYDDGIAMVCNALSGMIEDECEIHIRRKYMTEEEFKELPQDFNE